MFDHLVDSEARACKDPSHVDTVMVVDQKDQPLNALTLTGQAF